jgi:hypothetical protein
VSEIWERIMELTSLLVILYDHPFAPELNEILEQEGGAGVVGTPGEDVCVGV